MEKIAMILEGRYLYWSSIVVTMAALAAICGFLFLYFKKSERTAAAFVTVPLALGLSVFFARVIHWYCFAETYTSFFSAVTNYSVGGYALVGAFGGCLLAALLTRMLGLHNNLLQMLDCMCLAGGAGIAVGRLASFFNSSDRGQILESVQSMPWAYPVVNSVSGVTEYRLATFLLQAMITAVIVLVLLAVFLRRDEKRRDGDVTLLFLLCYGAAQVILDSTRYDSIYFRFNGFISIVQVMSALALGFVIVLMSVRMVKNVGFRGWYVGLWLMMVGFIGGAGYMEYYVQRHGNEAGFAYTVMAICLLAVVALTVFIYRQTKKE